MFETHLYQEVFLSFLENERAFLFIPETSEFKRAAFLNDIVEQLEKQKKIAYFRFSGTVNLEDLVHQITDQFFIPVRSVNVTLLRQLQDQADILRQTNQQVVLLVDDAHFLPPKDLLALLELAAYQKKFAALSVVFLGKPALEKRLMQTGKFSAGWVPETLELSDSEPVVQASSAVTLGRRIGCWMLKKRVRLISLILLIVLGFFFWWFERLRGKPVNMPVIIEKTQQKSPALLKIPELGTPERTSKSELKNILLYLKSIEGRSDTQRESKLKADYFQLNQERLPILPFPNVIKGNSE